MIQKQLTELLDELEDAIHSLDRHRALALLQAVRSAVYPRARGASAEDDHRQERLRKRPAR